MERPNFRGRTKDVILPGIRELYELAGDSSDYRVFENQGIKDLLEHLDLLLCQGTMSETTKEIIQSAIKRYINSRSRRSEKQIAVQTAVTLVLTSPDCAIVD